MLLTPYLIMGQTGFHRCVLRRRFFLVCCSTPLTSNALQQPPPLIVARENICTNGEHRNTAQENKNGKN